jgi:DNA-binding transcriptional MerR regulator
METDNQGKIPVADLSFDRQNPRLAEFSISNQSTDDEIIGILWDAMDAQEIALSIAASGFYQHEPVIVAKEEGKFIVIEGNRRLAAVKILLDGQLAEENEWTVPTISSEARKNLEEIPVLVVERKTAWALLGFKHVNGPAKWSSYAKAEYIARIHREYKIPLAKIAQQIGDGNRTVQRLFRGLMVLEQAKRTKVFDKEDRMRTRFAFSHLYTGLGLEGISNYINLADESEDSKAPIPKSHQEKLGEVLTWLYGSKSKKVEPIIISQNPNLRELDSVLKSPTAVTVLRDTHNLANALEASRSPSNIFEEALSRVRTELRRAKANVTGGYDGTESLLRTAGTIADLSADLYNEMETKFNKGEKPKRLTEE